LARKFRIRNNNLIKLFWLLFLCIRAHCI
jgi:hypothetical protein